MIAAFASRLRTASVGQGETLDDCENVIRARLDLAHCLIESGWTPSPGVSEQLRDDELLLAEDNGSSEHLRRVSPSHAH